MKNDVVGKRAMNAEEFDRMYISTFDNIQQCIMCGKPFDPTSTWYVDEPAIYTRGMCNRCARREIKALWARWNKSEFPEVVEDADN